MKRTVQNVTLGTMELKKLLESSGIDISKWGKGEAKTIENLKNEIESGESILEKNKAGNLVRRVSIYDTSK